MSHLQNTKQNIMVTKYRTKCNIKLSERQFQKCLYTKILWHSNIEHHHIRIEASYWNRDHV